MAVVSMLILLFAFFLVSFAMAKESADRLAAARKNRAKKLRERGMARWARFPRKIKTFKSHALVDENGFSLN
ncbi:MAG: hypothetical protein NZM06_01595 [Chloroherpetonaceae bacterium]|nr:hypothetical protein [Chloroherpetonaceae bacterium]MDW8436642.1 hypothetical protein [Chloroherpetonaceae bacterium]